MQSLFADPIELHSNTGATFVDIDGDVISQDETIGKTMDSYSHSYQHCF